MWSDGVTTILVAFAISIVTVKYIRTILLKS